MKCVTATVVARRLPNPLEIRPLYYDERLSASQIASRLDCEEFQVLYVMKKNHMKRRGRAGIHEVFPTLSPSPKLSYVVGVMKGDGSIDRRTGEISLEVDSSTFAKEFQNALIGIGFACKDPKTNMRKNGRTYIRVRAASMTFLRWYENLSPSSIAALLVDEQCKKSYIRGFYESEGSWSRYRSALTVSNVNLSKLILFSRISSDLGFWFSIYRHTNHKTGVTHFAAQLRGGFSQRLRFYEAIKPIIKHPDMETPKPA